MAFEIDDTPSIVLPLPTNLPGLRKEVRFAQLSHHQDTNHECRARIYTEVTAYFAGTDTPVPGLAIEVVELKADNNTVVRFPTGEILAMRRLEPTETEPVESLADWLVRADAVEGPKALQGKYFHWLRRNLGKTMPVSLDELIEQNIRQAIAMGRYADSRPA